MKDRIFFPKAVSNLQTPISCSIKILETHSCFEFFFPKILYLYTHTEVNKLVDTIKSFNVPFRKWFEKYFKSLQVYEKNLEKKEEQEKKKVEKRIF